MKPSLTLEELRRVARGLPSDGGHGYAAQLHDDAKAAANTAISIMQANSLNEEHIDELMAIISHLEEDNRIACAKLAELEAMVGRVEREAGLGVHRVGE